VEWSVGALFAVASAATVLFVAMNPSGDLEVTNLLRGELLTIGDADLLVIAVTTGVSLALFLLFRREILLASFDPEFARTIGRDPRRADALLFLLLGGIIALGVMEAGPLVVFGFLVLPPLAALRVAPGLGSALALAAAIGVACSIGGFSLAYRVDLPTGPTSVALAAVCWLSLTAAARWGPRLARIAGSGMVWLVLLGTSLGGSLGCGLLFGVQPAAPSLSRGTLPDLAGREPVAVARFRNDTGVPLRITSGNPLAELGRAVGSDRDQDWTVVDGLQAQATFELAQRGIAVRGFEQDRATLPAVPADAAAASRLAREGDLTGPVLFGRLRRFTVTGTGLLLIQLDLALVDPTTDAVMWTGRARRPVPIRSAQTTREILVDAAPAVFAEAFGDE